MEEEEGNRGTRNKEEKRREGWGQDRSWEKERERRVGGRRRRDEEREKREEEKKGGGGEGVNVTVVEEVEVVWWYSCRAVACSSSASEGRKGREGKGRVA